MKRRLTSLRRHLQASGVSAILITHLPDLRWLSSFTGSSAALVVTARQAMLFTDGRYRAQAAAELVRSGVSFQIVDASPARAAVLWASGQSEAASQAKQVGQPEAASLAYDAEQTTVAELDRLRAALPARLRRRFLVALPESVVANLRMRKDADEIEIMAQAAALGCSLFDHILGFLRPGLTEQSVAAELEHQARLRGAEGMSFETIVASGARSSMPHGRASSARLPRRGFLTLDFGVILRGYCSDMTRTVCFGQPTARERQVYDAVLAAQQSGLASVRAGATCEAVDQAARSVLRQAGMAEAFSHSTGHGVGLQIHEAPRIAARQKAKLQPGMVITIEPGAYFPGHFGVRIEDTVVVQRGGCRNLTAAAPTALIQL